jgi:hypothetical protein
MTKYFLAAAIPIVVVLGGYPLWQRNRVSPHSSICADEVRGYQESVESSLAASAKGLNRIEVGLKGTTSKTYIDHLTARVTAANTFASSLVSAPRDDTPQRLDIPAIAPMPAQASESVSEHEQALISFARYLDVMTSDKDPMGFLATSEEKYESLGDKVGVAEQRFRAFLSRGV